MIDIFNNYVKKYDMNNLKIKLKHDHSLRVMDLCIKYAKTLGFSDYDIKLASVIGLFHDIGRFEQVKRYNTFHDLESVDHAHLGVKILFEEGLINKVWSNKEDYELIKFAIENHNKLQIEKNDNERFMTFAKLIRDADKTDILYLRGHLKEYLLKTSNEPITKEVLEAFYNHKSILWKDIHNDNDTIANNFSYVFDIYNDFALSEVKNNITLLYNSLDNKKLFKDMYDEIIKYINGRLNNETNN